MSERRRTFVEALAELIDEHWDDLQPGLVDENVTVDDIEEMGESYPSCWVLTIGAASIEDPEAPAMSIRLSPRGQSPFTGIGLLEDSVHCWKG